jgi:hypothetical protein
MMWAHTWRCLLCDQPIDDPDIVRAHMSAKHRIDVDQLRQVAFEIEDDTSTREFQDTRGISVLWLILTLVKENAP